jgi:serine protease Do
MKRLLLLPIAALFLNAAHAQEDAVIVGKQTDSSMKRKNGANQKVITLRLKGENATGDKKFTIEVDGDKIKVNGKDVADMKDVEVSIGKNRVFLRNGNGNNFQVFASPDMDAHAEVLGQSRKRLGESRERLADAQERIINLRDRNQQPRALLGVNMKKTENGVQVIDITENSAAEKAGIKKEDIITAIDGKKMTTEMEITKTISGHKPGEQVEITYLRDGKEKKVTTTLGERKEEDLSYWFESNGGDAQSFPGGDFKKLQELNLNNHFDFQLAQPEVFEWHNGQNGVTFLSANRPRLGVSVKETESGTGLEVTEIEDNSAASKAGMKKGDVITGVAGKTVNSVEDIRKMVDEAKSKPFNVQFTRNGSAMNAEIKFPKKLKEAKL